MPDVVLPDGRVLNHELVRAGLAWWYQRYVPYDRELKRLEVLGRCGPGLWSEPDAVPPWERRRRWHAGSESFNRGHAVYVNCPA